MTKKEIRLKAIELKKIMMTKRELSQSKISDIIILLQCKENEDYTPMQPTMLYRKHSAEYCEILEMI